MFESHVKNISKNGIKNLIVIPFLIAILTFLAPSVFQLLFSITLKFKTEGIASISSTLAMITTVFIALFVMKKVSSINYSDLGLSNKFITKQIFIGAVGGFLILSLVVFLIYLFGGISFSLNNNFKISGLLIGLLFFIFQGTWEEIIYRSYLMPHFSKIMNYKVAIILTSLLFTLGHGLNPGMRILPVINLFTASIVFSLIYYYTGSLLIVGIGHGIWNFSQGYIFGAEVSGHKISDTILSVSNINNNSFISGGSFGFEGGIITTIISIILIIIFIIVIRKRRILNEK